MNLTFISIIFALSVGKISSLRRLFLIGNIVKSYNCRRSCISQVDFFLHFILLQSTVYKREGKIKRDESEDLPNRCIISNFRWKDLLLKQESK